MAGQVNEDVVTYFLAGTFWGMTCATVIGGIVVWAAMRDRR